MIKSVRTIALAALLSLAFVPALSAENMGTNPKPGGGDGTGDSVSVLQAVEYVILSYLGI